MFWVRVEVLLEGLGDCLVECGIFFCYGVFGLSGDFVRGVACFIGLKILGGRFLFWGFFGVMFMGRGLIWVMVRVVVDGGCGCSFCLRGRLRVGFV